MLLDRISGIHLQAVVCRKISKILLVQLALQVREIGTLESYWLSLNLQLPFFWRSPKIDGVYLGRVIHTYNKN